MALALGSKLGSYEVLSLLVTVSPDGKTIVYAKQTGARADLMMIENFG